MDQIPGNIRTRKRLFPGRYFESSIDFDDDQDWAYTSSLLADVEYELTLHAIGPNPLPSPKVRILDGDQKILFAGKTNRAGTASWIRFRPTTTDTLFLAALNLGSGTGDYRLTLRALDDDFSNNAKGSGTATFIDSLATAKGVLEDFADQDWFSVQLEPDTWYGIKSTKSFASFFLRDQNRNKVSALSTNDRFYSRDGGTFYVIVRPSRSRPSTGEYEINLTEGELPYLSAVSTQATSGVGLYSWIKDNEFPVSYYHIYSDDALGFGFESYAYREQPAGRVYRATKSNLFRWRTLSTPDKSNSTLYVRGLTSLADDGFKTPWLKINVANGNAEQLLSGKRWRPTPRGIREVKYSFADALPSYLSGDSRFPDFASIGESTRDTIREAIRRWDLVETSLTFVEVAPNATNDNAEMMIFSANIDSAVTAFYPAAFGGSDLVLDRDSSHLNDLRLGSRGFFDILRGVGQALGLKAVNTVDRNASVLGRYIDDSNFDSVYPTSPGPLDIKALTDTFDRFRYQKNREANLGNSTYQFRNGTANTVSDFGGVDVIDGSGSESVHIDLTPGASSYRFTGTAKNSYVTLSYDTEIENALGSSARDRLFGNGWNNTLVGGMANDFLQGRTGNDHLQGGAGGDQYLYELGDGHDVINEQDAGGRDKLIIRGMFTFNDITNDLTFQKVNQGKDLLINLSIDGEDSNHQGSIRIRNMHQRKSQIETLSVSNHLRDFGNISLRNLFQQAKPEMTRFRFTQGHDSFGRWVAPIDVTA